MAFEKTRNQRIYLGSFWSERFIQTKNKHFSIFLNEERDRIAYYNYTLSKSLAGPEGLIKSRGDEQHFF